MSIKRIMWALLIVILAVWILTFWSHSDQPSPASSRAEPSALSEPRAEISPDEGAVGRQALVAEAAQPPAQDAMDSCVNTSGTIKVVNLDYQPVPRAIVRQLTELGLSALGTTNDAGMITVDWPKVERLELLADKGGFGMEVVGLQPPYPSELTIILASEGVIYGVVRTPDGHPVGEGVRLVAIPASAPPPSVHLFEHACQDDEFARTGTTDSSGRYVIARLRRGEEYTLLASGGGMATPGLVGPIVAGDGVPHDVTVRSVYALSLAFYDAQTKEPLTVSQRLTYGREFRVSLKGTDLERAFVVMSSRRFLANCVGPSQTGGNQFDDCLFSNSSLPEAGPVRVEIAFPGYEPWTGSLNAMRIAEGLERQRVELRPITSEFGVLVLILPSCMRHGAPQTDQIAATVKLASPTSGYMEFMVTPDESGQVAYEGIPFGTYELSFSGSSVGSRYPPSGAARLKVEIGNQPARVVIPDMSSTSMWMDPRRADGTPYVGDLDVMVQQGADPVGGEHTPKVVVRSGVFHGPPYRVDLLVPGDYTLIPRYPRGIGPMVVTVAGPETRCTFQVP